MADAIPNRDQVPSEYKWQLSSIYPDEAAWEADFARIETLLKPLLQLRGKLNGVRRLCALFEFDVQLDRLLDKLYVYAHLREDENTSEPVNQGRMARMRAKYAETQSKKAWIVPEILSNRMDDLEKWRRSKWTKSFRYQLEQLIRQKAHTLSEKEETLLSKTADILAAPSRIYSYLTNADLRFAPILNEHGTEEEMSDGRYVRYLMNPNRAVRQAAFKSMIAAYDSIKNTVAATLAATVKMHNLTAEIREYDSALHAALYEDQIPVALYDTLIATTRSELPHYYHYLEVRRRCLGIEKMDMFDLYVPIVPDMQVKVPFEQAREWVIDSCEPLGDEYVEILRSSFQEGWIDIYENRGKRSGAYSSGAFDTKPYVLLNYQGTLNDVFTLAHELGHSMHTWLANRHQPPQTARYPIFIAEIASTLNEELLMRHLLKRFHNDVRMKAYLLNHFCDSFKGTVYRQTMFAEFEKMIHEQDKRSEPLTQDQLSASYFSLVRDYFGPDMQPDPRISLEWARIPHFYYRFYVYKYATSYCASQIFSQFILESPNKRDDYLSLLKAGGSAAPLELIKKAGVDLSDQRTLSGAFKLFRSELDALQQLL